MPAFGPTELSYLTSSEVELIIFRPDREYTISKHPRHMFVKVGACTLQQEFTCDKDVAEKIWGLKAKGCPASEEDSDALLGAILYSHSWHISGSSGTCEFAYENDGVTIETGQPANAAGRVRFTFDPSKARSAGHPFPWQRLSPPTTFFQVQDLVCDSVQKTDGAGGSQLVFTYKGQVWRNGQSTIADSAAQDIAPFFPSTEGT